MLTPEQVESFYRNIEAAGVNRTNQRAHNALERVKAGESEAVSIAAAVAYEAQSRALWLEAALDPWCLRHGISQTQALSIVFDDGAYNPANPEKDQVTLKSLFWGDGQHNDFAAFLMRPAAPLVPLTTAAPAETSTLGQRLRASQTRHEADERIRAEQAADKAAQIAFREREFVLRFFMDLQAQISDQIMENNKAVVINLRHHHRGAEYSITDLLGLDYRGQACLRPKHRFNPELLAFMAWAAAQQLDVQFQYEHDGVGIESWFTAVAKPLV